MIKISRSQNADSRTASEKVSKEVLLFNSERHISDVKAAIHWMMWRLLAIAGEHDRTKIDNIDEFFADFSAAQDGDTTDFRTKHWFKDIHLQERHHLESRVPDDVNLLDVLELIADCVMAGMARSGEVFESNLSPEILERAFKNTFKLLIDETVVSE